MTVVGLSGNLNGIQRSLDRCLPSSLQTLAARDFFNVVPPEILRPNPPRGFILHILPSPLLPLMTTTINTHSLLVQYLPTISPFGIDGNTCIQTQHSSAFVHLDIRPFRLVSVPKTFRTRLLSPPLTSMSKKHSFTELGVEHTPPVIYKHL
jgi:hypothetical protein